MSDIRLYRVMRDLEGKHYGNEYLGNLVSCGECKHRESCCRPCYKSADSYCSDGERKTEPDHAASFENTPETKRCSKDTIYRHAAIDALLGITAIRNTIPLDSAIFNIKKLPSAEPRWISVKERLPKDNVPVNITWINRNPESYYKSIKDVPFTATGVYFKGKWYWYSSTVEDYLAEYGRAEWDEIDEAIEITAWMPLPEPYAERRTDEH